MNNIKQIGWAIFGTSDGIQAKSDGCISGFDITNFVDVNNVVIKIFPNTQMLSVFREIRNGDLVTYYIKYGFANEIKTNRPGTFYGSALVLVNSQVKSDIAVQFLDELNRHLTQKYINNGRFTQNVSTMGLPTPSSYELVSQSLQTINQANIKIGKKEGIVRLKNFNNNMQSDFFNFSLNPKLTNHFSRIHATADNEILDYTKKKGVVVQINPGTYELKLEIENLKSRYNKLKDESQRNINQFNNNETKYKQSIDDLEIRYKNLDDKNKNLRDEIENNRNNNKYKNQISEQKTDIKNLNSKIRELESQLRQRIQTPKKNANKPERVNVTKQPINKGQRKNKQKKKSSSLNSFAEKFMNNPLSIFKNFKMFLILGFLGVLSFGMFKGYEYMNFTEVPTITNTNETVKPEKKIDLKGDILSKSDAFYNDAIKSNIIYEPNELNEIMTELAKLNLSNSIQYDNLKKIYSNYGLTGLPFKELEKRTYTIKSGDNSIEKITQNIYNTNGGNSGKEYKMVSFSNKLRAFNSINTAYVFTVNDTLIYYVPKN